MPSPLLSTAPGGEQTQYEASAPDMAPHKTESGQFGATEKDSTSHPTSSAALAPAKGEANTHGISPADKIRFGQSIQEGGMGGKTGTVTGEADAGEVEGEGAGARRVQGYGDAEADKGIGG